MYHTPKPVEVTPNCRNSAIITTEKRWIIDDPYYNNLRYRNNIAFLLITLIIIESKINILLLLILKI